jgi:hypothetical protein
VTYAQVVVVLCFSKKETEHICSLLNMNYYCNLSLYFLGYFTFHLSSQYSIFVFICRTDDEWIMYVVCKGSDEGEECDSLCTYKLDILTD